MDVIFDVFFDETFARLERSGLKTRQKRKDVIDHLNAVISGGCQGHNLSPEECSREAVLATIRFHRSYKDNNNTVCMMGKYHNVLYIGMKVAWEWGVTDSNAIKELLEEIFSCEQTFERIFLGALFGNSAPHFIAGWKSDFKDQDENTRAMVYFLQHATNVRLEFPVRQQQQPHAYNESSSSSSAVAVSSSPLVRQTRFVDVPIESCGSSSPMRVALQASAPDLLLILLRYGADPMPNDGGSSAIMAILDKLIESSSEQRHSYLYQLISCLNILLSCITIIDMPYRPLVFEHRKDMFMSKYGVLLKDRIITPEHVFGVGKLKHLCRCSIRETLRQNYQLPCGIQRLRIPRSLRRYVDLMEM